MSYVTSKRRPELFHVVLLFVATIILSFFLVDPIYPFPESVISGDPWWRYDPLIVIVTVIDDTTSDGNNKAEMIVNNLTSSDYFKEAGIQNKIIYADKYGYELVIKGSWGHIPALLETMKEYPKSDWLWWMNSNIFISNYSISLSSNVLRNVTQASYADRQMLIGYDCHGLNTASFLIRNSPWAKKFLETLNNPGLYKDFEDEETAMQMLIDFETIEVGSKISFAPLRTLNSLPFKHNCGNDEKYVWHKDDFVVNFTGCEEAKEDCEKRFEEILLRTKLVKQEKL
ncbi:633_t:CDS:2 [Funneliformis geosporum]|uniref:19049_t:CDS:1 n=1 Tax=Funneliformis geosporum TaxID=1117311 RepID=A0A9W4SMQ2_9GLOM|nr:633_t:CDS:2 [Funneliformis geosporum]CAI2174754.1 19049_t:CDS:2 [Funneliformis geosporum]